ncbi:uncharacterized protein LOC143274264 [Peromyscus maniculatus bairdii]|uniref:uncharacterized protein LOC143274264 n=1 Tax=Peromyscus maniculatus bairdii TaxID=230844 RepID=UPI003FD0BED0
MRLAGPSDFGSSGPGLKAASPPTRTGVHDARSLGPAWAGRPAFRRRRRRPWGTDGVGPPRSPRAYSGSCNDCKVGLLAGQVASLLCGTAPPGPQGYPSCGPPQSLRSPAPRPIPAAASGAPPLASRRASAPSQRSAVEAGQAGCPFGENYLLWRKDTADQNCASVFPDGQWGSGEEAGPALRVTDTTTPRSPGASATCCLRTWAAV